MKVNYFKNKIFVVIYFILLHWQIYANNIVDHPFIVTWDDLSKNELGFCVEYKRNFELQWYVLDSINADHTSYGRIHFEQPNIYFLRVYAYNVAGNSNYSNIITINYNVTSDHSLNPSLYPQDTHLPVEISTYTARIHQQSILLEWVTESEVDHLGFILERKSTSNEPWELIGSYVANAQLKGEGNTSERREYQFMDDQVELGYRYYYRLSDIDVKGIKTIFDTIFITYDSDTPEVIDMENAFPNPFNSTTKVMYHLSEDSQISINVYDIFGRKIYCLYKGFQKAGNYNLYWHGRDNSNHEVSSGKYIISLNTDSFVQSQIVTFLK